MAGLVSCIVPVYNGERFLAEAVASILAQGYRQLEILIVDDGSTDGTPAVARSFGPPVRYLRQENAGGPAARNLGIAAAGGELVGFLDADDRWAPDKLALQMARFEARPELDIALGLVQNFWMPEMSEERSRMEGQRRTAPISGYTAGTLLTRREVFTRIGPFNAAMRHGEQTEWFLRARDAGLVLEIVPAVLLERRLHAHNVSRQHAQASREQYLSLVKGMLDRRRVREQPERAE